MPLGLLLVDLLDGLAFTSCVMMHYSEMPLLCQKLVAFSMRCIGHLHTVSHCASQ